MGSGVGSLDLSSGFVGNKALQSIWVGSNCVWSSGGELPDPIAFIERRYTTYENDLVTTIGEYAFSRYSSLTSVSFPNVTSVGTSAFLSCTGLTSVSFPNVTSVGPSAFLSCTGLTSVSFPNVTSIGTGAFSSCTNLTAITVGTNSLSVCTLNSSSAIPGTIAFIYVPAALVDSYKAAENWSAFSDKIVGV